KTLFSWAQLLKALLPPLLLMISVLGSIFWGIASPTEAAAVGAFGSILLSFIYRKFSIRMLWQVVDTTTILTCMIFMILMGATAFGLVFRGLSGDDVIRDFVMVLPYGEYGFLFFVMLLIFILGCFLDFIE